MATALVGSPTSQAGQEGQFREAEPAAPEVLQATRDMCAYCFGEFYAGRFACEPQKGSMALKVEVDGCCYCCRQLCGDYRQRLWRKKTRQN